MREEKKAERFKKNARLFRFAAILAVLTLPFMACESPVSPPPKATRQNLSTRTGPSSTAVPATISPESISALQIRQLHMIDATTGWAEDTKKRILHTTHGVQSWENVSPPYPEGEFSIAEFFFDGDTAFLITTQMIPSPNEVKAQIVPRRTTDGGQTWQEGETVSFQTHGPFFPTQLYFLSKKHGWLLTQEFMSMGTYQADILETRDGGFHYDLIYRTLTGPPKNEQGRLFGVALPLFGREVMTFLSDVTGFATNAYEQLVVSQDGGRTWHPLELEQPSDSPDPNYSVNVVSPPLFSSDRDGVLIVRVYDRKQNEGPPFPLFQGFPQVQYLYYTHDAGQNWLPRPSPAKIGTISFLNSDIGWFLGKDDPIPSVGTQLYRTGNGGETWSPISPDTPLPLGTEIQFMDEQTGFAYNPFMGYNSNPYHEFDSRSGAESYLFASKDGGRSWSPVAPHLGP